MPEYLAPGVYVEEVDTGSKPIEGVSTSTAGMIGVTERGPANVPILITSFGEFNRWFGDRLNIADFSNGADHHCYLPYAVDGFFTNGGKRVYITRIESGAAARSTFDLHDSGTPSSAATMLLRTAPELTGTGGGLTDPPIYVLNTNAVSGVSGPLNPTNRIRIGGGSDAEYRLVAAPPGAATHVTLNFPLVRTHAAAITAHNIARVLAAAPNTFALFADVLAGTTTILVTGAAGDIAANDLLEVGGALSGEYRYAKTVVVVGPQLSVTLNDPLRRAYPAATAVAKLQDSPGGANELGNSTLSAAANSGDRVVFLTALGGVFTQRNSLIVFDRGNLNVALRQVTRLGSLEMLSLTTGAYGAYSAGTLVEGVTLADDGAVTVKNMTAPITAGASVLTVNNRVGLIVGDVIRIDSANTEYAVIAALPNRSPGLAAPDAGNIILRGSLVRARPNGTVVQRQQVPVAVNPNRPATVIVLDVASGVSFVAVTDGGTPAPASQRYLTGEFIRVTTAAGDVSFHVLSADAAVLNAQPINLNQPLLHAHAAGSPVATRVILLNVQALDTGAWGNRLRLSIEDENTGLVSLTTVAAAIGPTRIRLASAGGVEAGTILEITNTATGPAFDNPVKVSGIDRSTGEITLDATSPLSPAQLAAITGAPANTYPVRSREFRLAVYLLRQPDPTTPSRNDSIVGSETFRYLSMDPRHSRYVEDVIGRIGGPLRLSDHRSEGESWYIRVLDAKPVLTIPLGPEQLTDILPDGRVRPARHPLSSGNDMVPILVDGDYTGIDDPNPENRTGLHSLRNIEDISIIAAPGRTSTTMQNALINQCELMRYRFAVLDAPRTPCDTLADVQHQRQQFDTKYAALYHPWLTIPDPYPTSLSNIHEFPLPPSGHVVGIYARTDIERGVHKAPANEVIRGIVGLQRLLNKEQQDILNPFPVNINVIRDFRSNNRGIRVYGGRVITSDSDWKYVNVRRLLIFIEASLDRGLQWVVFEPNAEPLWARVRRSIVNFLTLVWRNGALEGTKPDEAFYVKCDRTTMTQTDIDSGRLIVQIGVAPVKPAEFVIVRIGLWTSHSDE